MTNVVEFKPREKKEAAQDTYYNKAYSIMSMVVSMLKDEGYDIFGDNRKVQGDIGLMMNLLMATMVRIDGGTHFLHDDMEELAHQLRVAKKLLDRRDGVSYDDDELHPDHLT